MSLFMITVKSLCGWFLRMVVLEAVPSRFIQGLIRRLVDRLNPQREVPIIMVAFA
jgi:hypothetical protein